MHNAGEENEEGKLREDSRVVAVHRCVVSACDRPDGIII